MKSRAPLHVYDPSMEEGDEETIEEVHYNPDVEISLKELRDMLDARATDPRAAHLIRDMEDELNEYIDDKYVNFQIHTDSNRGRDFIIPLPSDIKSHQIFYIKHIMLGEEYGGGGKKKKTKRENKKKRTNKRSKTRGNKKNKSRRNKRTKKFKKKDDKIVQLNFPNKSIRWVWLVKIRDDGRYIIRSPKYDILIRELKFKRDKDFGPEKLAPKGTKIFSKK